MRHRVEHLTGQVKCLRRPIVGHEMQKWFGGRLQGADKTAGIGPRSIEIRPRVLSFNAAKISRPRRTDWTRAAMTARIKSSKRATKDVTTKRSANKSDTTGGRESFSRSVMAKLSVYQREKSNERKK